MVNKIKLPVAPVISYRRVKRYFWVIIPHPLQFFLGMCADAINNCANYGQGVCSDPTYTDWVLKNCQAYCHKCPGTSNGNHGAFTGSSTGWHKKKWKMPWKINKKWKTQHIFWSNICTSLNNVNLLFFAWEKFSRFYWKPLACRR